MSGAPAVAAAEVVVRNPQGMHLRPATEFARVAQSTGCRVRVAAEGGEADGTSVLELAMLGVAHGVTLRITTEGEGAQSALDALVRLVNSGFSEI